MQPHARVARWARRMYGLAGLGTGLGDWHPVPGTRGGGERTANIPTCLHPGTRPSVRPALGPRSTQPVDARGSVCRPCDSRSPCRHEWEALYVESLPVMRAGCRSERDLRLSTRPDEAVHSTLVIPLACHWGLWVIVSWQRLAEGLLSGSRIGRHRAQAHRTAAMRLSALEKKGVSSIFGTYHANAFVRVKGATLVR